MGHQPHGFDKRLGNENAVERILMVRGEFFDSNRMFSLDCQEAISGLTEVAYGILAGDRYVTAPQGMLDGNFPDTCNTDPDSCLGRQDDDLAYRAARWALAGDYLGLGADVILGCRFTKIDHIQARKIQDIDGLWGGRKRRIPAFLTSIPSTCPPAANDCAGAKVVKCLGTKCLRLELFQFFCPRAMQQAVLRFDLGQPQDLG